MTVQPGALVTRARRLRHNKEDQMQQYLLIPIEKAQELTNRIASLAIPYVTSRPIMEILEKSQIVNANPTGGPNNGSEAQQQQE